MKRKFLLLFMLTALFVFAGFKLGCRPESWLRTEKNGLCFELDYLHTLAEREPYEARQYLGSLVTFTAPLDKMEKEVDLDFYGRQKALLYFAAGEGKWILVDCCDSMSSCAAYKRGELLMVRGRLTAISRERMLILNSYGSPGFPNDIEIKPVKQSP